MANKIKTVDINLFNKNFGSENDSEWVLSFYFIEENGQTADFPAISFDITKDQLRAIDEGFTTEEDDIWSAASLDLGKVDFDALHNAVNATAEQADMQPVHGARSSIRLAKAQEMVDATMWNNGDQNYTYHQIMEETGAPAKTIFQIAKNNLNDAMKDMTTVDDIPDGTLLLGANDAPIELWDSVNPDQPNKIKPTGATHFNAEFVHRDDGSFEVYEDSISYVDPEEEYQHYNYSHDTGVYYDPRATVCEYMGLEFKSEWSNDEIGQMAQKNMEEDEYNNPFGVSSTSETTTVEEPLPVVQPVQEKAMTL
jgi:hypothetical protein